jgi:Zn-dependent peptidase ImmA (M78 family)
MTVMPVNPDVLRWAREHRGLSLPVAAELLGMTQEQLQGLETGQPINLAQFRRISGRYRIPAATLLRRTIPNVPPLPQDFRTMDGDRRVLGLEIRLAIDYARTVEHNILEMVESGFGPATPALPRLNRAENAAEAGERERERLGIPVINQMAWPARQSFAIWRAIVERAGVFVLFQKFGLAQAKGFTLFDTPNTPLIVISKVEEFEPALTFTLIHEYAHLLLREPGISDQRMDDPVEAFCNRFAAGFLIPRAALHALLPAWPERPTDWERAQIRDWAGQLKVSQQAMALRLEELGLAPPGFFGRFVAGQPRLPPKKKSDGGNYVNTQLYEMGNRYLRAVLGAVEAGNIKPGEAAEMTQLAPSHFEFVRQQVDQKFERAGAAVGGLPY